MFNLPLFGHFGTFPRKVKKIHLPLDLPGPKAALVTKAREILGKYLRHYRSSRPEKKGGELIEYPDKGQPSATSDAHFSAFSCSLNSCEESFLWSRLIADEPFSLVNLLSRGIRLARVAALSFTQDAEETDNKWEDEKRTRIPLSRPPLFLFLYSSRAHSPSLSISLYLFLFHARARALALHTSNKSTANRGSCGRVGTATRWRVTTGVKWRNARAKRSAKNQTEIEAKRGWNKGGVTKSRPAFRWGVFF